MKEDFIRKSRRSVIKSAGVLASGAVFTGAASASEDGPSISESEVIESNSNYEIQRYTIEDKTYVTLLEKSGEKKGEVTCLSLDSAPVTTEDLSSIRVKPLVSTQGEVVVDRSKNIGGSLNKDCKYNYCDNRKYEHRYGGVTIELTERADYFSNSALVAALGTVVKTATRFNPQFWVLSAVAGWFISQATGESITLMPKDNDGFFGPEIQKCYGLGWDLGPNEVQQYSLGDGHLGGKFNPSCSYE